MPPGFLVLQSAGFSPPAAPRVVSAPGSGAECASLTRSACPDNAIRYSPCGSEVLIRVARCRPSTVGDEEEFIPSADMDGRQTDPGEDLAAQSDAAARDAGVDDFFDEEGLGGHPQETGSPSTTAATMGSIGGRRTLGAAHAAGGAGAESPLEGRLVGLRFEVQDSGVGMSQEALSALFTPFTHPPPSVRCCVLSAASLVFGAETTARRSLLKSQQTKGLTIVVFPLQRKSSMATRAAGTGLGLVITKVRCLTALSQTIVSSAAMLVRVHLCTCSPCCGR